MASPLSLLSPHVSPKALQGMQGHDLRQGGRGPGLFSSLRVKMPCETKAGSYHARTRRIHFPLGLFIFGLPAPSYWQGVWLLISAP